MAERSAGTTVTAPSLSSPAVDLKCSAGMLADSPGHAGSSFPESGPAIQIELLGLELKHISGGSYFISNRDRDRGAGGHITGPFGFFTLPGAEFSGRPGRQMSIVSESIPDSQTNP